MTYWIMVKKGEAIHVAIDKTIKTSSGIVYEEKFMKFSAAGKEVVMCFSGEKAGFYSKRDNAPIHIKDIAKVMVLPHLIASNSAIEFLKRVKKNIEMFFKTEGYGFCFGCGFSTPEGSTLSAWLRGTSVIDCTEYKHCSSQGPIENAVLEAILEAEDISDKLQTIAIANNKDLFGIDDPAVSYLAIGASSSFTPGLKK